MTGNELKNSDFLKSICLNQVTFLDFFVKIIILLRSNKVSNMKKKKRTLKEI